ncbi:MAG: T9SS type A sorting domain-containing protein [Paludibacteraceae bacterium]|nr:T9SS type A sorting domain-containing protein [Paludibacteraceae bacterium]
MKTKFLTLVFLLLCTMAHGADGYYRDYFYKTNKKCNDYVVIMVGGYGETYYPERFFYEAYKSYQYFVNVKGCDKSRVKVLFQDGKQLNLDNDQTSNDVAGAANEEGINKVFDEFKTKMTQNDELYFVVFAHGGKDNISLYKYSLRPTFVNTKLSQLKYKKANFILLPCHGGSWIDDLKKSKHTIITCAGADYSGYGDVTGDAFSSFLYKGLAGRMKVKADPGCWSCLLTDNETVNVDYNNDGVVSLEEAFVYAKDNEKHSKPGGSFKPEDKSVPRYWSYDTPWRFCRPEVWGVVDTTIKESRNAHEIKAMYLLNATGTISGSADVTLSSGKMIRLKKGFKVNKGAKFRTFYIDCEDEKNDNPNELRKFEIVDQEVERENGAADITVSPNPSTGRYIVTLGEVEADVTVLDMQGRVIRHFANASGDFELDITDFPNGVYVLALNSANFKLTQKIVKF